MDMVRKDFTEGKVKQQVPATITYISNDLPMLPGEAGLRCVGCVCDNFDSKIVKYGV